MKTLFRATLVAGLLAVQLPCAFAQNEHAADIEALKAYHFGDNEAPLNNLTQWVREARDDQNRRAEAAKAFAAVLNADAPFDAKQFAARQLVFVAGENEISSLISLLKNDNLAHYATRALLQIPSPNVGENLRRELPRSNGKARLEIINALGERRDKNAVETLAALLKSDDEAVIFAAANALGEIGEARSVQAVREVYQNAPESRRVNLGRALLRGADLLRESNNQAALSHYQLLQNNPSPQISAGALRGIVLINRDITALLEALKQDNTPQQRMAAVLSRDILKGEQGARATQLLANSLPQLSPVGQALLLNALGERGDVQAAPAVAALLTSADADVRSTAATAIGELGDATTVPLLLNLALTGAKEGRDVARSSLLRLKGGAIDEKLLASLDKAAAPQKVEIIGALQARRVMAAVPRLLKEANNPQPEVRRATLLLLRDMAPPTTTNTLLDLLPATAPDQRGALLDTIAEIARRGDETQGAKPIVAKFSASKNAADKADLLGLLGRIGGPNALQTLRVAVQDQTPGIRLAALRALSNWDSDEPLNDLLGIAQKAPDEKSRLLALRGAVRLAALNENRATAETLALYRQVGALDGSAETKRAIISGLAKLKSGEALDYAAGFLKDDAVRPEAELASVSVARGTLGAYREKSRAVAENIAKTSANENTRKSAQEILDLSDKLGDFVTAWEVSPAYEQAGANVAQLFDIAFAPEDPKQAVAWRVMPVATSAEQPWLLDLLALHGGDNRVAYLRTSVWSDKERELVLETGSDDGTKAWWNGQVVLSQNVQRAVAPAQEKTKVTAKAGWNDLLLKITQNNQGWGAVARFTNPDGTPAAGLRFALPSKRE